MINSKNSFMLNNRNKTSIIRIILGIVLFLSQFTIIKAADLTIQAIDFASLSGGNLQMQIKMNGDAIEPKVFQTDKPARIVLDFPGVKSELKNKTISVNQGAASNVHVVQVADRVRVVMNLVKSVPYKTKISGNQFFVTLTNVASSGVTASAQKKIMEKPMNSAVVKLMPEQSISDIDFRRGVGGEGRILISLANPNTVVNSKEQAGKIILSFLNTKLPKNLLKRLDVSEFATPVRFVDVSSERKGAKIVVEMQNNFYDYSLFQSEGLLTVEFRPVTKQEKELLDKKKSKYTGDRLSLNFQNIDLRSVISILAEFTGQNIVAGDDVTGNITLKLDDVPWDEALDFIMMSKGMEKYQTGNVILVAPVGNIKKYKEQQRDTENIVQDLEPLQTEYIQINYANAEDILTILVGTSRQRSQSQLVTSGSTTSTDIFRNNTNTVESEDVTGFDSGMVLSSRGSATLDARTNIIIVTDTAKKLAIIHDMIDQLDIPVRQVMIESRIVIADKNFAQEMGVKFGVAKAAQVGSGPEVFAIGPDPTRGQLVPNADGTFVDVPTADSNYLVDLGASAIKNHPVGALGMTLARAADYVLNLELSALENENRGEIVANPRVMTSDRVKAFIKQGVQIPYTTVSQDGTQTQLIDAVLELNVTPQITPNGDVVMNLKIKKDAANNAGGIDKREINTTVQVKDGETVVLGGVYEGETVKEVFKIPFFGDLPGIGFLFKKNIVGDDKRELLIFVTPKIIRDTEFSY